MKIVIALIGCVGCKADEDYRNALSKVGLKEHINFVICHWDVLRYFLEEIGGMVENEKRPIVLMGVTASDAWPQTKRVIRELQWRNNSIQFISDQDHSFVKDGDDSPCIMNIEYHALIQERERAIANTVLKCMMV